MNRKITHYISFFILVLLSSKLSAINNTIALVSGGTNCTFEFRDTAGSRTFTPTTYFWSFGDGNSSTQQNASHTYYSNGTYTVIHIISNGTLSDTAILSLPVSCVNNPLKAGFSSLVQDTINNFKVFFTSQCEGRPTTYFWSFGDGNSSSSSDPIHTYSAIGTYTVKLKVYDGSVYDSISKSITIKAFDSCAVFSAYFHANRDTNCMVMVFSNMSHYTASSYSWDFGDGSGSSVKNPSRQYAATGWYDVTLIASSSICSDTVTQKVRVTCRTCFTVTAMIDLQVDTANPSKAILYNYSYGIISSHFWDFGDGNTSTSASPVHTYTSPGNIVLKYIATDTGNCTDTAFLNFTIDSLGRIKRGQFAFTLQVIDRTKDATSVTTMKHKVDQLKIYPQPASAFINIENTGRSESLFIYDLKGGLIQTLEVPSDTKLLLNVSDWSRGLYLIRTSGGETYKVMIE